MNDSAAKIPMTVIAFGNHASPMEEAWPSTHRAMFPIAGKALIVRVIEQLQSLGIKHVRVAGSIQQFAVRQRLKQGDEWGISVRYSDLHGPDLRMQTLAEFGRCLYLRADALHVFDLEHLADAQFSLVREADKRDANSGCWAMTSEGTAFSSMREISSSPYQQNQILRVEAFHQANLNAASGAWEGLHMPGARIAERATIDWDSDISHSAGIGDEVFVGRHCKISRRVQLHGKCVIGNGTVIMPKAELHNVTVLPNCFIGPGVKLRDAVVTPVGLYDLYGKFWAANDSSAFGRTRHNDESTTGLPDENLSETERQLNSG